MRQTALTAMDSKSLDLQISEFNELTQDAKEQLHRCIELLDEGKAPLPDELSALDSVLEALKNQYTQIEATAREYILPENLPDERLSVEDYGQLAAEGQKQAILQEVEEARKVLHRFLQIRSRLDKYAPELTNLQKDAQELLDLLNEPEVTMENLERIVPSRLFVEAVAAPMNTPEWNQLVLKDLEPYYSSDVRIGFFENAYYFLESAAPADKHTESSPRPTSKQNQGASVSKKSTSSKIDKAPKEKPVHAADAEEEADTGLLILSRGKSVGKRSATAFQRDLQEVVKSSRLTSCILAALAELGIANEAQLSAYIRLTGKYGAQDLPPALKKPLAVLLKKGILTEYEWNNERIYRLSEYAAEFMDKKMIWDPKNRLWDITYRFDRLAALKKSISDRMLVHEYAQTSALMAYLEGLEKLLPLAKVRSILADTKWNKENYVTQVPYKGEDIAVHLILDQDKNYAPMHENILFYTTRTKARFPALEGEYVFRYLDGALSRRIRRPEYRWIPLVFPPLLTEPEKESTSQQPKLSVPRPSVKPKKAPAGTGTAGSTLKTRTTPKPKESEEGDSDVPSGIQRPETILPASAPSKKQSLEHERALNDFLKTIETAPQPEDRLFVDICQGLLSLPDRDCETMVSQALVLAKSAALLPENPQISAFSEQLELAANLGIDALDYSSANLIRVFGDDWHNPLVLSAYAFALLAPAHTHDYVLRSQAMDLLQNYDTYLPEYAPFKPLLALLAKVPDPGFSRSIMAQLGNAGKSAKLLGSMKGRAQTLLEPAPPKNRMKRLPELYRKAFGVGSDIHRAVDIIVRDDRSQTEFMRSLLEHYGTLDADRFFLNQNILDETTDELWNSIHDRSFKLQYVTRDHFQRNFRWRLELMFEWLSQVETTQIGKKDLQTLAQQKKDLLNQIQKLKRRPDLKKLPDANLFAWMLQRLEDRLNLNTRKVSFGDLLLTGRISLSEDGRPLLDEDLNQVHYYEPWRNVGRHIADLRSSAPTPEVVAAEIRDDDFASGEMMDNLNQLRLLSQTGRIPQETIDSERLEQAQAYADDRRRAFDGFLELAQVKGQIGQSEKERFLKTVAAFRDRFYAREDFGSWRRFLQALRTQTVDEAQKRIIVLHGEYEKLRKQSGGTPLFQEGLRVLENEMNLTLAEEYLERLHEGQTQVPQLFSLNARKDFLMDFLSADTYGPLFETCRRNENTKHLSLRRFGTEFLSTHQPADWTAQQSQNSRNLLMNWPSNRETTTASHIQNFLTLLGLEATKAVSSLQKPAQEIFQVDITPTSEGTPAFAHPIAALGTRISSSFRVVVITAHFNPQQLLNTLDAMHLKEPALVLLDHHWDAGQRRQFAELAHKQSLQTPLLLIDQVLALYLSLHTLEDRLTIVAQCTLPFTHYQPFTTADTPQEMMRGRSMEKAAVFAHEGASFVFGPVGIGKSSLLRRVHAMTNNPSARDYAVLVDLASCTTETQLVQDLQKALNAELPKASRVDSIKTIAALGTQISKLLEKNQIHRLHLLFDDTDAFFDTNKSNLFELLAPLAELKEDFPERFQFVCTSVHDATADKSLDSIWGTPLALGPLPVEEAVQLLTEPLEYLGFRSNLHSPLETLAAYSNCFPSALQRIGRAIVDGTLSDHGFALNFSASAGNPPYELSTEILEDILVEMHLNDDIMNDLRRMLSSDPRYLLLAQCIAYLQYLEESASWEGAAVDAIVAVADTYDVKVLTVLSAPQIQQLLDELVAVGLFASPAAGKYRLRRSSILNLLGDAETVEQGLTQGALQLVTT